MKPGLKRLIAGVLLLVLAVIIPVVVIVRSIMLIESAPEKRFEIPGRGEFHAHETGRYYLWHHGEIHYGDTSYQAHIELPSDLKVEVRNGEDKVLNFVHDRSLSFETTSDSKRSIGYFELTKPATLSVSVQGDFAPTVSSISQFKIFEVLGWYSLAFAFATLCGLLGLGFLIWGIVRLCIGKQPAPPPLEAGH